MGLGIWRGGLFQHCPQQPLEAINDVFKRLEEGEINGRVVLNLKAA